MSDDLTDALRGLGHTADAIAASLREAGVRGERGSAPRCALANWLEKRGFESASVD